MAESKLAELWKQWLASFDVSSVAFMSVPQNLLF